MSDKIVWLAAYPKTGSTWVRTIIQQVLGVKIRAKEAIPSFDRDYPEDAPIYNVMGTEAKVLRTHCHPGHPAFQAMLEQRSDQILGIITIQRHPLDVMLSQLNYSFILERTKSFKGGELKKVETIIADGEIDYYIDRFIETGGCPEHIRRCSEYAEFYRGWQDFEPAAPHLSLRYEDMVEDPVAGIKALTDFLQVPPVDPAHIADQVESRTQVNGKFFWRKRAYNHRDLLPKASIRRFEEGFADGLRSLGYPAREATGSAVEQ